MGIQFKKDFKKLLSAFHSTRGRDTQVFGDDSGNTRMTIPTTPYHNLGPLGKRQLKQTPVDSFKVLPNYKQGQKLKIKPRLI